MIPKRKSPGSGWHKHSKDHSDARKYGAVEQKEMTKEQIGELAKQGIHILPPGAKGLDELKAQFERERKQDKQIDRELSREEKLAERINKDTGLLIKEIKRLESLVEARTKDYDRLEARAKEALAKDVLAAQGKLVYKLLPFIDTMDAMRDATSRGLIIDDAGTKSVYAKMLSSLNDIGVREITHDELRKNAGLCEVSGVLESKEPDGAIIQVVKKGYFFKDSVLRPAAVIVSRKE